MGSLDSRIFYQFLTANEDAANPIQGLAAVLAR